MNVKNLSRQEKEKLYIEKMSELQKRWNNPIDNDWDFVSKGTDDQLDKMLVDVVGQLRFEKTTDFLGKGLRLILGCFILFGIIGLLVFGIRQLFN